MRCKIAHTTRRRGLCVTSRDAHANTALRYKEEDERKQRYTQRDSYIAWCHAPEHVSQPPHTRRPGEATMSRFSWHLTRGLRRYAMRRCPPPTVPLPRLPAQINLGALMTSRNTPRVASRV